MVRESRVSTKEALNKVGSKIEKAQRVSGVSKNETVKPSLSDSINAEN